MTAARQASLKSPNTYDFIQNMYASDGAYAANNINAGPVRRMLGIMFAPARRRRLHLRDHRRIFDFERYLAPKD